VKRKRTEESEEVYETELAQLFAEEDEVQGFFAKLDGELNKVNHFYKKQENEFVERGETLKKQLNILLELKQLLTNRRRKNPSLKPSNSGIFPHSPSQASTHSGTTKSNTKSNEILDTKNFVISDFFLSQKD